jgi:hypothetical protein
MEKCDLLKCDSVKSYSEICGSGKCDTRNVAHGNVTQGISFWGDVYSEKWSTENKFARKIDSEKWFTRKSNYVNFSLFQMQSHSSQ